MVEEIIKEWRCSSSGHKAWYSLIAFFFALMAFGSLANLFVGDPDKASPWLFFPAAAMTLFILYLKKSSIGKLKQIRFTPEYIYVENKKLPINLVDSITLIDKIRCKGNAVMGFHFKLKFKKNTLFGQEIEFYMEFGKIALTSNMDKYDYQKRFIDVILKLASK